MKKELLKGNFGIEKETLRVSKDAHVVSTPHPFGTTESKFRNPHITVDFCEQQVEVITGINPSIESAVEELKILTNIVYRGMNKDEYLWNYSIPYGDTTGSSIALGDCPAVDYRKGLLKHSRYDMQLISGIHFNFSFDEDFISPKSDDEVNALYFKIAQDYARVSFVIKNMFGMSPTSDFINADRISYRQSPDKGYHNWTSELECFCGSETFDHYNNFINQKIKEGKISSFREVYTNIRMKPFDAKRTEWIEVRNIDLDYTEEYGVNIQKLDFIHKFLLFLAFGNSNIALEVHRSEQKEFDFEDTLKVLHEMKKWMTKESLDIEYLNSYIDKLSHGEYDALRKPIIHEIIDTQVNLKDKIKGIPLKPIDDMELSTQILIEEAYKSGMAVEITNRKENKVKVKNTILEMATLNPFDSKKGLEIIDSKVKTNKFLKENGYSSTEQNVYTSKEEALRDFNKYEDKKIVIKPVNTNFSKGLTVFENGFDIKDFEKALAFALSFDTSVIVEKFISGQEYRFLVIDSKLIGVLKRVPANIIGNGINTIKELIDIKNQNKLRGTKYKLPLEKIKLTEVELDYISKQNLSPDSVIARDEIIYLRKNSNVSTGGDTYDVTDAMHKKYKEIAIEATSKLNLKVCGLDIIIPDIETFGQYTILEMNWNPAIHIHTYPLVGKNRHPAEAMIELVRKYDHE